MPENAVASQLYAVVRVDIYNETNDRDYNNNEDGSTNRISITERDVPDLVPIRFVAPDTSFSGQRVALQWDVVNDGPGATTGSMFWTDRVAMYSNIVYRRVQHRLLGFSGGDLSTRAGYTESTFLKIPEWVEGNQTIFLDVNFVHQRIYEGRHDRNNRMNATVAVILSPPPDFNATLVTTPPLATPGVEFEVCFS